jgi:hypothetical protein
MVWGAAISAGANILGGMAAGSAQEKAAQRAENIASESAAEQQRRIDAIKDPELKKIVLENPELVDQLTPEQLDDSKMKDIQLDPRLQEARMGALQSLMQKGEEGLTAQDKAQYEEMLMGADAQEKARQDTILSQMAQRGALDSGAQLASQLASSQGSASNARKAALQMAADSAAQRASAQSQAGQMAGQMQSQDFARQAQAAQARDAIAKFNAANRQDVGRQNLQARQTLENLRASNVNREQSLENVRQQQIYGNKMGRATRQNATTAGLAKTMGQSALAQGKGQAQMYSGIGSAVGSLANAKDDVGDNVWGFDD